MELCSAFSSKIEFQNVHAKEEGLFTLKKAFPVPLFPLHSIFRHSTNQNATCIVHSGTQKVQCQSIPPPPLSPLVIIIIVAVALLSATSNQRPTPPPPKEEELASPPFLIILHHNRQTREGGESATLVCAKPGGKGSLHSGGAGCKSGRSSPPLPPTVHHTTPAPSFILAVGLAS